jgi:hypothetical protein
MARESGEFQISELLKITEQNKYAAAVAAFEVVDSLHMLDLPSKWSTRKAAVQAMMALSRDVVRFGFISDDQRKKLEAELQASSHRNSAEALFRGATAAAPVAADSSDELDEIGPVIEEEMIGDDENVEGMSSTESDDLLDDGDSFDEGDDDD